MALDVADFLFNSKKKIMFLEAPVGTGKSLGVLIPSLLYTKENKNSILYATSTINLQHQIYDVDSIMLEKLKLLKTSNKILAQGKSNYTCKTSFKENIDKFTAKEKKLLFQFFETCKFGLFSELEILLPSINKNKYKYLSMEYVTHRCEDFKCPGHRHRSTYKKRHQLTITNHNQLNQSYVNEKKRRAPIVNFRNNILIIDEAHSLKENFLASIEKSYNTKNLRKLKLTKNRKKYFSYLNKLSKSFLNYIDCDSENTSMRYKIQYKDKYLLIELMNILNENLISLTARQNYPENIVEEINDASEFLSIFLKSQKHKSWIQFDNKDLSLHYVDLNFNRQFQEYLFNLSSYSKIILMSGTLTVTDYEKDINVDWNLTSDKYIYKNYPTVFSLDKQSIMYIPKNYPNPNSQHHLQHIQEDLPRIIKLISGGTLILCTSNKYLTYLSKYLKENKKIHETIYVQGDQGTQHLSNKFRKDINSILVGSGSFFTGFSIEGKSLNKLLITKLPYPVPTDPYIELISQGYERHELYDNFYLPIMLKKLEQGLGRLIRSNSDFGIITLFDSRVYSNKNIKFFIEKLGYKITSNIFEVEKFIINNQKKIINISTSHYNKKKLNLPTIILNNNSTTLENNPTSNIRKNLKKENEENDLQKWLRLFVQEHKKDTPYKNPRVPYKKCHSDKEVYQAAINFCHQKGIDYKIVAESFPTYNKSLARLSPTVSGPVITITAQ
jgi:ATP-dependent DNA helicase DinG